MGLLRRLRERMRPEDSRPEPPPSRLVVGLGNPGDRYARTRHNIGFRVLEALAADAAAPVSGWRLDRDLQARVLRVEIDGEPILLAKPETFMNRSGETVIRALERWSDLSPETDLVIVHDDLDLPVGRIRLRPTGGSGGHRGMTDILDRLGTRQIPRLRFGIGHPRGAADVGVVEWVLEPFSEDEEREILPAALARAAEALEAVVREGVPAAMGRFNASPGGLSTGGPSPG
ncbi:MAG: aminoacyl-tRNA hydrolase [bacterium]